MHISPSPRNRRQRPADRRLLAILALAALTAGLRAAEPTGALAGRVTDARTKLALGGTRVLITGTELSTFADSAGEFALDGVPAGERAVTFGYVGYPEVTRTIRVEPGRTARTEVAFGSDVVTLDRFVITGSAVGSARAINRQRAADTLTSIVASDEIGRFADQNVAETMQRIPGLALYRDQSEGRFIVVRGIRPDLNSVRLDGVSMASPERGDRVVALDVLPTDALAAVEVTKVPTPDMDGDGLGGSINVRTRSAFDAEGRQVQVSAQGQYSRLADRFSSKFNATVADRFAGGRLGFIFTPTWQARRFGSNNFEEDGGWALRPVPGAPTGTQAPFLTGLAFREYEITRTRYGASSALEFKPEPGTHVFLRGTFTQFNDRENRYVFTLPFAEGTVSALSETGATVTGVRRERHDVRFREKDQRVFSAVLGAEKTAGPWQLDGRVAWSRGEEERPAETTVRFRKSSRGSNWTYSFAPGTYAPTFVVTGASLADPSLYNEISRFRVVDSPGEETEFNAAFNARRTLRLGETPAYVKAGAQLRAKEKRAANETVDYAAPAAFTFASVLEGQTPDDYPFFSTGLRASTPRIQQTFRSNSAAFTPTRLLAESVQDDWTSTEAVTAAYAMGGATRGRLHALAGVRLEHTRYENRGNELTGTTVRAVSRGRTYENLLPGLHLRYDLDRQTLLRASWGRTLARPSFDDSALRRSVNQTASRVTEGNPRLSPLESTNWDASLERYLPSLGLLSAAVFRKEIKNFTYQREIPDGDPATGYTLSTFVNGPRGRISGLELAWQQQLRGLPAPFDSLGFMANYTWTESRATYPTRPGETLDFIGQSKEIGNFALTFQRGGFFVRAALNFRTPRLREDEPLGGDASTDRWVDDHQQVDVTVSYRLTAQWELYAEGLNLTNEPFRVYFGKNGTRLTQFEEYGAAANFGVRWRL
jgi:TonB-dependent receptor